MKLLIHDLSEEEFTRLFPNITKDIIIVSNNAPIQNCIGCFGCWIKTPGACVIRDEYGNLGEMLSKCDEMLIISECFYGGFSDFTKNVLDRGISFVHPYFVIRKGKMHHKLRYKNRIKLKAWFYGNDITDEEKETAKKLVNANAINFNVIKHSVTFYNSPEDMGGEAL